MQCNMVVWPSLPWMAIGEMEEAVEEECLCSGQRDMPCEATAQKCNYSSTQCRLLRPVKKIFIP